MQYLFILKGNDHHFSFAGHYCFTFLGCSREEDVQCVNMLLRFCFIIMDP
jgi:hypothetical protein